MRQYETIAIFDPDLSEEQRGSLLDRIKETLNQHEGLLVEADEWGGRKLAYEIKKKERGYYVCLNYCGNGELVNELERQFRIDDRVLKYMTVVLDKFADVDQIRDQLAKAAEAEAAAAREQAEAQSLEEKETPSLEAESGAASDPEQNEPVQPESNEEEK